ncbi:MAG: LPS export ABC transporter periplasmic protein LptC [Thalassotalea sp.]
MNRLYLFASLIFGFATFIYVQVLWQSDDKAEKQSITTELTPDYIAQQLKTNIYNTRGDLTHSINANRMEHYTSLAVTHFEQPKYTLYPKNNASAWNLSANEGMLNHNNRVRLENRVLLKATDDKSMIQEIHGKYFELDLNTNIISSDQTIMILGKDFTMYGSGLIVDLNTTQMTLTEHVQTIYKKNPS